MAALLDELHTFRKSVLDTTNCKKTTLKNGFTILLFMII